MAILRNKTKNKIGIVMGLCIVGIMIVVLVMLGGCIEKIEEFSGVIPGGGGDVKSAMKMIPSGENFMYVNLSKLRSDKELDDIYEGMKKSFQTEISEIRIDIDDINYIALGDWVTIYCVKFDKKEIADGLDDVGYDKEKYDGVDVWEKEVWGGKQGVTIKGGNIILGSKDDVEDALDVMKGKKKSVYDNYNMRKTLDKLPDSFFVMVSCWGYQQYDDQAECVGSSMKKLNKDKLEMTIVVKFESADDARSEKDDILDDCEDDDDLEDCKVSVSGEFVILKSKRGYNISNFSYGKK